jgi:hypothetical protein
MQEVHARCCGLDVHKKRIVSGTLITDVDGLSNSAPSSRSPRRRRRDLGPWRPFSEEDRGITHSAIFPLPAIILF